MENNAVESRLHFAALKLCLFLVFLVVLSDSTSAVRDNEREDVSIEWAIQELIDSSEPSTGHFSELELALIDKREAALPTVIQMMTDERVGVRIHAAHVLAGIAKKGFGWSIDKGVDGWREDDFNRLWRRLGDYSAVSYPNESEDQVEDRRYNSQRLWRRYAELIRLKQCHVGDIPLSDVPSD